jgi:hypothetical protein
LTVTRLMASAHAMPRMLVSATESRRTSSQRATRAVHRTACRYVVALAGNPSFKSMPAITSNRYLALRFLETVPGPQAVGAVAEIVDATSKR